MLKIKKTKKRILKRVNSIVIFKKNSKADKKDPKGKVEEEEQKEEPPIDTLLKKECDFVYFLMDYPSTKVIFFPLHLLKH